MSHISSQQHSEIKIAAAIILNPCGEMLLVRKVGTTHFMLPGGKMDAGEAPRAALLRELQEELSLTLTAACFSYQGCFSADAANEPDHRVAADVFSCYVDISLQPCAEIEELCWVQPDQPGGLAFAPLLKRHIFTLATRLVRSSSD